uniref:hypothetical protein n=1 Tax=Orrella sp. TaxID=1921583 RepID=UPI0040480B61
MAARVAVVGDGDSDKDGEKTDDVSFYKASHPRESGLINPEALRGFWPSLSLGSTSAMKAVSVDGVWQSFLLDKEAQVESDQIDVDGKQDGLNWLVVDCLAGVVILEGASEVLKDTAVVCVRALRDVTKVSSKQPPTLLLESGVEHLDLYLDSLGFRRVAFVADSHPDVGYGVYCRDGVALAKKKSGPLKEMIGLQEKDLAQVKSEREGLNKQLQEMTVSLDQAKQTKEQAVAEINDQLKTVTSDKEALAQQKTLLEADAVALKQKLSELTKKLGDAEKMVETVSQERASLAKQSEDLTQQKDEAVKRLGDIEAKLAAVAKEKEALVAQVDVLGQEKAALVTERDALIGKRDALSQEKNVLTNDMQALIAEKTSLVTARDKLASEKAAIAAELEDQKKAVAERQVKIEELTQSVQGEAQKAKDLSMKVEGLTAEKAALAQQKDEVVKKLGDTEAERGAISQEKLVALKQSEELAKKVETLKAEVGSLKQSVDAVNKEKEDLKQTTQKEHEADVHSLNSKHQEAVTKLQQQTDVVQKELESAKKSVTQLQQQVKDLESVRAESNQLKAENDELHQRQLLMNEELVKAEGQITLIKDLLLREQGI